MTNKEKVYNVLLRYAFRECSRYRIAAIAGITPAQVSSALDGMVPEEDEGQFPNLYRTSKGMWMVCPDIEWIYDTINRANYTCRMCDAFLQDGSAVIRSQHGVGVDNYYLRYHVHCAPVTVKVIATKQTKSHKDHYGTLA